MVPVYGSNLLRMVLDDIPLWRGNHVLVKQLCEDFAQYLYLPQLKNARVLIESDAMNIQTRRSVSSEESQWVQSFNTISNDFYGLGRVKRKAVRAAQAMSNQDFFHVVVPTFTTSTGPSRYS